MAVHQTTLEVRTGGQGPHEITEEVIHELKHAKMSRGTVSVFCQHTSCSLMTMENADPSAWNDLQAWFDRLAPENDRSFRHTLEGSDDMPSHIKMALTRTSETIPFCDAELLLGSWQGIFLWEHRRLPHRRTIVLTFMGE